MTRSVIEDAAISAAKAYSHAAVEPRHVLFALARSLKENPECAAFFAPAKRALEPSGSSFGAPAISDEARALLDTLKSDDDGVAALKQAFASGSAAAPASNGGQATQSAEQSAAAESG